MKRIVSLILAVMLCASLAAPAMAADKNFSDVPSSHWAYTEIHAAAADGITTGYSDGTFRPTASVTNAHFATFLARAFYLDEIDYDAIPWFKPYTNVLDAHDILSGTALDCDTEYDLEINASHSITRYDMAQMMYNIILDKGLSVPDNANSNAVQNMGDWAAVPNSYKNAVAACYALGVLTGQSDGNFGGQNLMNRAQGCVVIYRLLNKIETGTTETTPVKPVETAPVETAPVETAPAETTTSSDHILTNGKPITEANVLELIEELKVAYPSGTLYQPVGTWYRSDAMGTTMLGDGCTGWAFMASDYIFGQFSKTNKARVQTDHTNIRPGDVIQFIQNGETIHWALAISRLHPEIGPGNGSIETTSSSTGNNKVVWNDYDMITYTVSPLTNEAGAARGQVTWVVYTRYPD